MFPCGKQDLRLGASAVLATGRHMACTSPALLPCLSARALSAEMLSRLAGPPRDASRSKLFHRRKKGLALERRISRKSVVYRVSPLGREAWLPCESLSIGEIIEPW